MKGITPIVSIIILLLITIGLAASAYTFLSGFMGGYTKGSVMVIDSYCRSLETSVIKVRNAGTEEMSLGTCESNPRSGTSDITCGSLTISRTDGRDFNNAKFDVATLGPQEIATFTDKCTDSTDPHVCTYRFMGSGMGAVTATANC